MIDPDKILLGGFTEFFLWRLLLSGVIFSDLLVSLKKSRHILPEYWVVFFENYM